MKIEFSIYIIRLLLAIKMRNEQEAAFLLSSVNVYLTLCTPGENISPEVCVWLSEQFPDKSHADGSSQDTGVFVVPSSTFWMILEGHDSIVGGVVSTGSK